MNSIKDFKNRRNEDLEIFFQGSHCEHANKSIREYEIKNGYQYRYQCLSCGEAVGNAISKDVAYRETSRKPEKFDYKLRESIRKNKEIEKSNILKKYSRDSFIREYSDYLESEKWKQIRNKVIQRCNNICEGCMSAKVDEVHHNTYERVGRELLTDLHGFCHACHMKAHGDFD